MLRRAPEARSGVTHQDVKRDLSAVQLAGIGAIVMIWNEVEFMLEVAIYSGEALDADCLVNELPRLRPDEKIRRVLPASQARGLPQECRTAIASTGHAFRELNNLRNAVVHSRVLNCQTAIGHRSYGGKVMEVLLTPEALDWLYGQLCELQSELRAVLAIFDLVRNRAHPNAIPDEVQHYLDQIIDCQQRRARMGEGPSFPTA